jgi:hypothetical protein
MAKFLTTSEIARMYGLADSTVRHYRCSGRLVPTRQTPGGHARYAVAEVISALGEPEEEKAPIHRGRVVGMEPKSFAAPGRHDLRSSGRGGAVAPEILALGLTEDPRPAESSTYGRPRWGGRLLKAPSSVPA